MSKIYKYKDMIYNFLISKSSFAGTINNQMIKDFVESNFSLYSIVLSALFNIQVKNNEIRSYHILHMASAIILMTMLVVIGENISYYESKYGSQDVQKLMDQSIIYVFSAITQNNKTMENALDIELYNKIQKKISQFLQEKLLLITEKNIHNKKNKMKRTDIIKYRFKDTTIIDEKYRKLSRIDDIDIKKYIKDKYGSIGQCAVVFGWLMGGGDQKNIDAMIELGESFGTLVKLVVDFHNVEDHIQYANETSYNYIVNCGIHASFDLYDEQKIKFIEGCIRNNMYNNTIKEVIEELEKTYDACLKNTDIELESQYSSFVSQKSKKKK